MDDIMASGFVLYLQQAHKHDCSRCTWLRENFLTGGTVELAQRVSGRKNREDLYIESIIPGAASERAEEP